MRLQRKGRKACGDRIPIAILVMFLLLAAASAIGVYIKHISLPEYIGKELTEAEVKEVIKENSPLTSYVHLSPNADFPRNSQIKKITIHHMAANLSLEKLGESFGKIDRNASSNYGIDIYGNVALYVEEKNRAWTSSNAENDNMAITIEVANEEIGGDWRVSDSSYEALIELCTDICRRNGIEELIYTGDSQGNMTMHKMFNPNTDCPGPYLEERMEEIAEEVNANLRESNGRESLTYK